MRHAAFAVGRWMERGGERSSWCEGTCQTSSDMYMHMYVHVRVR